MSHCYAIEGLEQDYVKYYARHQLWNLKGYAINPKDFVVETYVGSIPQELLLHRISMVPFEAENAGTVDFEGTDLRASELGGSMVTGDLVLLQGPTILKASYHIRANEAFVHARYDNIYRIKVQPTRIILWSERKLSTEQLKDAFSKGCKNRHL